MQRGFGLYFEATTSHGVNLAEFRCFKASGGSASAMSGSVWLQRIECCTHAVLLLYSYHPVLDYD